VKVRGLLPSLKQLHVRAKLGKTLPSLPRGPGVARAPAALGLPPGSQPAPHTRPAVRASRRSSSPTGNSWRRSLETAWAGLVALESLELRGLDSLESLPDSLPTLPRHHHPQPRVMQEPRVPPPSPFLLPPSSTSSSVTAPSSTPSQKPRQASRASSPCSSAASPTSGNPRSFCKHGVP